MRALLAVSIAAAAQPAAWAQDAQEPVCVFEGLIAAAASGPPDPSRISAIRDECRQRFGWSADQGNRGAMVAMIMFEMLRAQREAREAGVAQDTVDAVRASFDPTAPATLGLPGEPVTEAGRATIDLIARRVRERGITGEAGSKATRAVLSQMMAENIIADFSRDVMPIPAP